VRQCAGLEPEALGGEEVSISATSATSDDAEEWCGASRELEEPRPNENTSFRCRPLRRRLVRGTCRSRSRRLAPHASLPPAAIERPSGAVNSTRKPEIRAPFTNPFRRT
jgi:hypothetical protein